jgi:hypothetical protein
MLLIFSPREPITSKSAIKSTRILLAGTGRRSLAKDTKGTKVRSISLVSFDSFARQWVLTQWGWIALGGIPRPIRGSENESD